MASPDERGKIPLTPEALEEYRRRLFAEKVKLNNEKDIIDAKKEDLERRERELAEDRRRLEKEADGIAFKMKEMRESAEYERKRLKDDKKYLDKRRKIIERAYAMLETDKESIRSSYADIDRQKKLLKQMRNEKTEQSEALRYEKGLFFRGVNSAVALKKRYKDLMRIYHPDNMCGDKEMIIKIKDEYEAIAESFGLDTSRRA